MRVIDPGHEYDLDALDGDYPQTLVFVKREGDGYPGNVGHHSGTTTQEVLRACIDRLRYVNRQVPCYETAMAVNRLENALYLLEARAARRHKRKLEASFADVIAGAGKCLLCGHVGCDGGCRREKPK